MGRKIVHMPYNMRKYSGAISKYGNKYRHINQSKGVYELFDRQKDAERARIEFCMDNNLIKNVVHQDGNNWSFDLNNGQRSKFEEEDLYIIDSHIWHAKTKNKRNNNYYAATLIDKKFVYLHNYLLRFTPNKLEYIIHINGDTLDNCKSNLKIVRYGSQNIIHKS